MPVGNLYYYLVEGLAGEDAVCVHGNQAQQLGAQRCVGAEWIATRDRDLHSY